MKKNAGNIVFWILLALLIVEGVLLAAPKREQVIPCPSLTGTEQKLCWERVVTASVGRGDVSGALSLAAFMHDSHPGMAETCHALTHTIGTGAYRLYQQGRKFTVTPKTAYCSYGFYHGFMEALVSERQDMALARSFCAFVDEAIRKESPDASLQCFHGIGHGAVNNHDSGNWGNEDAFVLPALALCSQVATTDDERSRCATGVFNGLALFYTAGEYGLSYDPKDPLHVCRKQERMFQDPCFISMNTLLLQITDYDLARAASYLTTISDDDIARHAIINLASPVGTRNMDSKIHDETVRVCRGLAPRLRLACIQGYAYGFLEHGIPGKEYRKPLAFCESDLLTKEEKNACFEYILSYLPRWYGYRKVLSICTGLTGEYRTQCRKFASQSL